LGTPEGVTSIGAPAAAVAELTRQAMAPEEPRHQPCWKKLRRQLLGHEKMGRWWLEDGIFNSYSSSTAKNNHHKKVDSINYYWTTVLIFGGWWYWWLEL
jgi:hypothetical protein